MRRRVISSFQDQIRQNRNNPIALRYKKGQSNTTRSKSYKTGCSPLSCDSLNHILEIDPEKRRIWVEPRVTMHQLAKATLPYGLLPPVIPEFKGITVGGAIMGAAAESTSHRYGLFHDTCTAIELLDGQGNLLKATPEEKRELFYGISGSYGSLGMLTAAELELIPVAPSVKLHYIPVKDPHRALEMLTALKSDALFLDGIVFHPQHAVVIAGNLTTEKPATVSRQWFAQKVQSIYAEKEEVMPLYDYLFRYDRGAFWMGSFLFKLPFLTRYISQGLCKREASATHFSEKEIDLFKQLHFPSPISRFLANPLMSSQRLWGMLHRAESWVQDRLVIQDCSIPTAQAHRFLELILKNPGVFPLWLCPLKGTETPQHFAPHQGHPSLINFGLYGVSSFAAPMEKIVGSLEAKTHELGGRKVLYSRSYYSEEMFWKIYPREAYLQLRQQTHSEGTWRNLTEKVLSRN